MFCPPTKELFHKRHKKRTEDAWCMSRGQTVGMFTWREQFGNEKPVYNDNLQLIAEKLTSENTESIQIVTDIS